MRTTLLFLIALIGLSACWRAAPPPPALANAASPTTPRIDRRLAVVYIAFCREEASNLGGQHCVFEGEAAGKHVTLHAGGHGVRLGLPLAASRRWFVAEVGPLPPLNREWVGDQLPRFDGEVVQMVAAGSPDEAEAVRARLAVDGWPPCPSQNDATAAGGSRSSTACWSRCCRRRSW